MTSKWDAAEIARLHFDMLRHRAQPGLGARFSLGLAACDATWALVGYDVRKHAGEDVERRSDRVIVPLPEPHALFDSMRRGHPVRAGHPLRALLVTTTDGLSHVKRTCCGAAA